MSKLYLIISSNRCQTLPEETINVINATKTKTVLVKQNLPAFYKNHPYIHEILTKKEGLSLGRNTGIKYAMKNGAQIMAFTDDDCIITKEWIEEVRLSFKNRKISAVFGKTKPFESKKHKNEFCPCTFSKESKEPVVEVCRHWENVGFGNNMAFRSEIFQNVGLFKLYIGPGTKIPTGDDAELIVHLLVKKVPIYYNPKMLVYHNKWLSGKPYKKQIREYLCGTAGVYGFYAFKGDKNCIKIVKQEFKKEFRLIFGSVRQLAHPKYFLTNAIEKLITIGYLTRCLGIAFYHALTKQI